jgi:glycosyltransferase involved in cell wall biosynthesis
MLKTIDNLDFISIVIPSFNRFPYLQECLNSIHEQADFPFELIVHDDGSADGTDQNLFQQRNRVSSIIFSTGLNLGLAESINRAVRLASSNYVLMLNADMKVEKPFFRDIFNILHKPYVGYIPPLGRYGTSPNTMDANGSPFTFTRGMGQGCCLAFRKDVWNQVGGWNNRTVATSNADVSFMIRILSAGYFSASLVKPEPVVSNMSMDRVGNRDSTIGSVHFDCSLPRIFNTMEYVATSRQLCSAASDAMQISYRQTAGEVNLDWWHHFMCGLIDETHHVNWEKAKEFNHERWREQIDGTY